MINEHRTVGHHEGESLRDAPIKVQDPPTEVRSEREKEREKRIKEYEKRQDILKEKAKRREKRQTIGVVCFFLCWIALTADLLRQTLFSATSPKGTLSVILPRITLDPYAREKKREINVTSSALAVIIEMPVRYDAGWMGLEFTGGTLIRAENTWPFFRQRKSTKHFKLYRRDTTRLMPRIADFTWPKDQTVAFHLAIDHRDDSAAEVRGFAQARGWSKTKGVPLDEQELSIRVTLTSPVPPEKPIPKEHVPPPKFTPHGGGY